MEKESDKRWIKDQNKSNEEFIYFKLLDQTTGKTFYADERTGKCSWIQPNNAIILTDQVPVWREFWDAQSEKPYYINNKTNEIFWTLPEGLETIPIPFSSEDDKCIRNSLALGHDHEYTSLIVPLETEYGLELMSESEKEGRGGISVFQKMLEYYEPQEKGAFCGLASASITLNYFLSKKKFTQLYLYELIHDRVFIDGENMKNGIALDQLGTLLVLFSGITLKRRSTTAQWKMRIRFEMDLTKVFTPERKYERAIIINYRRKWKGHNYGHFSPISAFCAKSRQVLIMDTSKHKFPPHWIPIDALIPLMCTIDHSCDSPRGYLLLKLNTDQSS